MTVAVWRVSRTGKIGQERAVTVTPVYADILPAPGRVSWRATAGSIRIEMTDPKVRAIAGADFRYTSVPLGSSNQPGLITEATWEGNPRLDSRTVLLQPGNNALFHINFEESGRYRIYARYYDTAGNAGPISELGVIPLSAPVSSITTLQGAPEWHGIRNNLIDMIFGSDVPLIPDTAGDPKDVTGDEWENPVQSREPDKWQARVYKTSGSPSDWVDIAPADRTRTITGLANGEEHQVDFRAVYDDVPTNHSSHRFTPRAAAVVPPKPTLTGSGSETTLNLKSVIQGPEDSRARIQRHQYRIASSESALASATWVSIPNSAGLETDFTVTGLASNAAYYVQTRGVNSVGNGTASDFIRIFLGGAVSYGNWVRITDGELITPRLNLLTAPDGVFRNADATYAQWTDTTAAGAQTQHQLFTRLDSGRGYRRRTRNSSTEAWGAFTAWGNADAYTITNFDLVDAGSDPRIVLASSASNTFMRGEVPTDVYGSRWITYNVIDSVTGAWTKQVAVKHYQRPNQTGQQYRFERAITIVMAVTAPPKPTVTATATGFETMTIAGSVASDGGRAVDRWEYRQATSETALASASWVTVSGASGDSFSLGISGLAAGTAYFFQARARNSIGYSPASDVVEESTPVASGPGGAHPRRDGLDQ